MENQSLTGVKYKIRYVQVLMLFFIVVSSSVIRWIMSVTVLAMTEKFNNLNIATYEWDKKIQGFILSSFLWGEMLMQFVAGVIICKYGVKRWMSAACIISGVLVILLPLFASYGGWIGVCVSRVLQGMLQCFINPCVHSLLGKWAPLTERTRMGTFIFAGGYISTIYSMPISSYLIDSIHGWPWVLYLFGSQSILFGVIWQLFGAESPSKHNGITIEERNMIETSLNISEHYSEKYIPWKSIFTSLPFMAFVLSHICCDWGYTVIHVEMPSYFRKALKIDIKYVGFLTSLADLVAVVTMVSSSVIADKLLSKNKSMTFIRKLFNVIGAGGASISLTVIGLGLNYNYISSIILIIVSVGFDATLNSGFILNDIDLSPNFAGILYAISCNFTKLVVMLGPTTTGLLVKDMSNISQWNLIFLLSALMYCIGNLVFLVFGSGKKQQWNSSSVTKFADRHKENLLEMQNY